MGILLSRSILLFALGHGSLGGQVPTKAQRHTAAAMLIHSFKVTANRRAFRAHAIATGTVLYKLPRRTIHRQASEKAVATYILGSTHRSGAVRGFPPRVRVRFHELTSSSFDPTSKSSRLNQWIKIVAVGIRSSLTVRGRSRCSEQVNWPRFGLSLGQPEYGSIHPPTEARELSLAQPLTTPENTQAPGELIRGLEHYGRLQYNIRRVQLNRLPSWRIELRFVGGIGLHARGVAIASTQLVDYWITEKDFTLRRLHAREETRYEGLLPYGARVIVESSSLWETFSRFGSKAAIVLPKVCRRG